MGTFPKDAAVFYLLHRILLANYSIAKKFRLSVFKELNKIITEQSRRHLAMKEVFDNFLKRKKAHFNQYNNFILKSELKERSDGIKIYFVTSIDPNKITQK